MGRYSRAAVRPGVRGVYRPGGGACRWCPLRLLSAKWNPEWADFETRHKKLVASAANHRPPQRTLTAHSPCTPSAPRGGQAGPGAAEHPDRPRVAVHALRVLDQRDVARVLLQVIDQSPAGDAGVQRLVVGLEGVELADDRVALPDPARPPDEQSGRQAAGDPGGVVPDELELPLERLEVLVGRRRDGGRPIRGEFVRVCSMDTVVRGHCCLRCLVLIPAR